MDCRGDCLGSQACAGNAVEMHGSRAQRGKIGGKINDAESLQPTKKWCGSGVNPDGLCFGREGRNAKGPIAEPRAKRAGDKKGPGALPPLAPKTRGARRLCTPISGS